MWACTVERMQLSEKTHCVFSNLHKPRTLAPHTIVIQWFSANLLTENHPVFISQFDNKCPWPIVFPPFKTITSLAVLIFVRFRRRDHCTAIRQSGFNGTGAAAGNEHQIRLSKFTGYIYTSGVRGVPVNAGRRPVKRAKTNVDRPWRVSPGKHHTITRYRHTAVGRPRHVLFSSHLLFS